MSKVTSSMLKPQWKHFYDGYKKHKKLSRFGNNEMHRLFNNLLLGYLYECQKNEYLPSKQKMDDKAAEILESAEDSIAMGGADPDRLSPEKLDQALQQMSFAPVQTDQDERGRLPHPYLCVFGLVSIKGLTKNEKIYLSDCFNADYDANYDAINITLMKVPICGMIDEDKQDKINAYCLRVARNILNTYLQKEANKSTGFKYSFMQKLKDKILDGSI